MDGQRKALEKTIKAGAGILTDQHAALLAFCRQLADQMDASGDDGPSTRISAAYLSALKDLTRALTAKPDTKRGTGKLAQLRGIEGGRASTTKRTTRARRTAT